LSCAAVRRGSRWGTRRTSSAVLERQGPDNRRSEWHPWPGPEPFEDGEGYGSYYLFFSGAAEYREAFPTRFEWALDLK